jgi:lactoylglutathione lyase/glyoxylase I family protein
MIRQIGHVCIRVSNIDQTINFYHKQLGLPIKIQYEKEGKVILVLFEIGNMTYLEANLQNSVKQNPGHFSLETEDIDKFMHNMKLQGIACTEKSMGCEGAWQTWVKDPDGNNFEIQQYMPSCGYYKGGVYQANW